MSVSSHAPDQPCHPPQPWETALEVVSWLRLDAEVRRDARWALPGADRPHGTFFEFRSRCSAHPFSHPQRAGCKVVVATLLRHPAEFYASFWRYQGVLFSKGAQFESHKAHLSTADAICARRPSAGAVGGRAAKLTVVNLAYRHRECVLSRQPGTRLVSRAPSPIPD